jgi:hypothetical protein
VKRARAETLSKRRRDQGRFGPEHLLEAQEEFVTGSLIRRSTVTPPCGPAEGAGSAALLLLAPLVS